MAGCAAIVVRDRQFWQLSLVIAGNEGMETILGQPWQLTTITSASSAAVDVQRIHMIRRGRDTSVLVKNNTNKRRVFKNSTGHRTPPGLRLTSEPLSEAIRARQNDSLDLR